jgi:hypothetical protein
MRITQSTVLPQDRHMPEEGWRLRSTTPEMRVQLPPTRPAVPNDRRSATISRSFTFVVARHIVVRRASNTHMTNRIQHLLDERAESPRNGEYFVVAGEFGQVFVARGTACRLRTLLTRFIPPRWIEFRTLAGALVRARARQVHFIMECTPEQRAAVRQFWRNYEAEDSTDRRPWDLD